MTDAARLADDDPVTLKEACTLFLRGVVQPDTLREAIKAGKLSAERIGRGYCVTRADIREWRERCRVNAKDQGFGCNPQGPAVKAAPPKRQSGSSGTEVVNIPLAAARISLQKLKEDSRTTSRKNTTRR
ncbi:helix-turn-helix domain-containing protein [uncultured Roseibium sp.]|uniref:helix-turn-helix domain-containing protein n=1 Tax=uncultured Roseibium sp. TaxID=1936171 RepID=UPI00260C37DB|nr:helix-turn-helix domain-containing protein [uncultured Roseibium sp.]